jgi:hypothetical protein
MFRRVASRTCGGRLTCGFVLFARTRAERVANGDPRPSLEERYGDEASYLRRVEETARRLVEEQLLLPEDAKAIVQRARDAQVFRGHEQANI